VTSTDHANDYEDGRPATHAATTNSEFTRSDVSAEVLSRRLGNWSEVRDRLLVRMVPRPTTGHRWPGLDLGHGFELEPGIDLDAGIARINPDLVAQWDRSPQEVSETAIANTIARLKPVVESTIVRQSINRPRSSTIAVRPTGAPSVDLPAQPSVDPTARGTTDTAIYFSFITGSPWATGAVVALHEFVPPSFWPRYASWFSPTVLAVFGTAEADRCRPRPGRSDAEPQVATSFGPMELQLTMRLVGDWFHQGDGPQRPNLFRVGRWPRIAAVALPNRLQASPPTT
jgi:hypothetical protein